jgi:hypothetical protein
VIVPVVMGRSMELNATTTILACLFWELLWGIPGLFLAMPLMAGIKAICENVPDWQPWANLMSTRTASAESAQAAASLATSNSSNLDPTQILMPEESDREESKKPTVTKRKA